MTKHTRNPEARKAEIAALHQRMAEQVAQLATSEGWRSWVEMAGRLHHYSFRNILLIKSQNRGATRVAGFRAWQEMGRQVRKGEHGIRILGGRRWAKTDTDEQTGEENTTSGVRFFPCSVFDISQTDPIDGQEEPAQELQGVDDGQVFARVAEVLTAKGWTVSREQLPGGLKGETRPEIRVVAVAEGMSDAMAAAIILHEAAHIELGHTDRAGEEYKAHRGVMEVEAESVAHILGDIAGLDTSSWSIGYVTGWAGKDPEKTMAQTAEHVITTAAAMARSYRLEDQDEEEPAA